MMNVKGFLTSVLAYVSVSILAMAALILMFMAAKTQAGMLMWTPGGKTIDVETTANGYRVIDLFGGSGITELSRVPGGYVILPTNGDAPSFIQLDGMPATPALEQNILWDEIQEMNEDQDSNNFE